VLRMRLRRVGAKKQPRYRVVIARARSPRDGAFVENIGYYDPLTEPATVHIDRDKALSWIAKGAQPSDTVQRLLRGAGILEGGGARVAAPVAPVVASPSAVEPVAAAEPAPLTEPAPAVEAVAAQAEEPTDGDPTAAN
jgi:small subunit ribosomal protein S16